MTINELRKKTQKDPNLPDPDNTTKNALIAKNVDDTFFKKPEPPKEIRGGGTYSTTQEESEKKNQGRYESEVELKSLMGIPEGNTRLLEAKDIKSWLKKSGVDTSGINFDNYAEVIDIYKRTKGNSPKDPRDV